jgi:hypothetical protein
VHFHQSQKRLVDEVPFHLKPPPALPISLKALGIDSLPCCKPAQGALRSAMEVGIQPKRKTFAISDRYLIPRVLVSNLMMMMMMMMMKTSQFGQFGLWANENIQGCETYSHQPRMVSHTPVVEESGHPR